MMKIWFSLVLLFSVDTADFAEDYYNIYINSGECLRVEGNRTIISINQHSRCTSFSLSETKYLYLIRNNEKKCLYYRKKKFLVKSCNHGTFGRLDINFLTDLVAINDNGTFHLEFKENGKNQETVTYLKSAKFGMFLYNQKKCVKHEQEILQLKKYRKANECSLFNWGSTTDGKSTEGEPIFFLQPNKRIKIVETREQQLVLLEYTRNFTTKYTNYTHIQIFDKLLKLDNPENAENKDTSLIAENHRFSGKSYNESMVEINRKLDDLTNSKTFSPEVQIIVKELVEDVSVVLQNIQQINTTAKGDTEKSFHVTSLLRQIGDIVSEIMGNQTTTFYAKGFDNLEFGVSHLGGDTFNGYEFPPQNDTEIPNIRLPKGISNGNTTDGLLKIKSILYQPLKSMQNTSKGFLITNNVISTRVWPKFKPLGAEEKITMSFPIYEDINLTDRKMECVYWDYDENKWRNDGCVLKRKPGDNGTVVCECDHLTDFSILLSVVNPDYLGMTAQDIKNLHFITFTGCIISIVFLVFAIIIIISRRKLRRNQRYQIHINLCISLILGNLILLFSEKKDKSDGHCMLISVLLFYFFLASFFWMLCEAIFVWRALITIFTENDRLGYYLLFGWGSPIGVVLITGLVSRENLITEKTCWLSWNDSTIIAFAAPILAIILINTVILAVVLAATNKHAKESKRGRVKSLARMVLILLPVFGLTWVFGVLAVNEKTLIFRYIFATFNSLQGFLIFICYIQASLEVRQELRKATWEQYSSLFKRGYRSQTTVSTTF